MFEIKTEATLKNVLNNRDKAGEDEGDVGLSLSLKTHIEAFDAVWLMGGDETDSKPLAAALHKKHERRFHALTRMKLNAELKQSVSGKVGEFEFAEATAKNFELIPTVHDLIECHFKLYIYAPDDAFILWAIHHEHEQVAIEVRQTEMLPEPKEDPQKDLGDAAKDGEQQEAA